jgi:hypothetical protein
MAVLVLALLAIVLFLWGTSLQGEVRKLKDQLRPITSIDLYTKTAQKNAESSLAKARSEAEQIIESAREERQTVEIKIHSLRAQANSILAEAQEEAKQITSSARDERRKIETWIQSLKAEADSILNVAQSSAEQMVASARQERQGIEIEIQSLKEDVASSRRDLEFINEQMQLKEDDTILLEVGYYKPIYGFEDLSTYQQAIEKIKETQKAMLRIGGETGNTTAAAYGKKTLTYNGSEVQGRKRIKKVLQLMLRAFNGECDTFIARVNYRNASIMQKRIRSAFDQVNKIAETWHCELSPRYLENRLDELNLVYEYAEFQEKIKEEQSWIRQQEREEEKARREAEKREREAARRVVSVEEAVRDVRQALEAASESQKAAYKKRIKELEDELAGALEERKRAKSHAEQTRFGCVYIFSNVESFGEDIYKIGMTRREDPEERRRELGDASVPFPFDCHAYIWTEDAPSLERELHKHFDARRLNLENQRKEFFKITIDEIQSEVERLRQELGITAEIRWTLLAEAKDFRLSEAKRKHLEGDVDSGV